MQDILKQEVIYYLGSYQLLHNVGFTINEIVQHIMTDFQFISNDGDKLLLTNDRQYLASMVEAYKETI